MTTNAPTDTNQPTALDLAAYALDQAKSDEEAARAKRIECEEAVIRLTGLKDEGTIVAKTAFYKVSVTQGVDRKLSAEFAQILNDLPPEAFNAIVKYRGQLDVRAFKDLAAADPAAFQIAQKAVIAKPTKPAVKVELIEEIA